MISTVLVWLFVLAVLALAFGAVWVNLWKGDE